MKRPPILATVLLAVALSTLGCDLASPGGPPPPDTTDWTLVLEDDFSDPESGFTDYEYSLGRWFYENGYYGIEVWEEVWVLWTDQGDYADLALEVEIAPQVDQGCAGLVFRAQEDGRYYRFCVATDGQYTLDKIVASGDDGEATWEDVISWSDAAAIHAGLETNHLRVICQGTQIWLYVNDELIATAEDEEFEAGAIGMIAENFDGEKALYHFDNLRLYVPGK